MSNIFYPKKHRFYKKANITSNVALRPIYGDLYGVTNETVNLNTTIDSEFLLASTNVASTPQYGGGELAGATLQYYVNTVDRTNPALIPRLKVYKADETATLTSGSFPPFYNNNNQTMTAFSSYLDYDNPWMEEQFSGVNQGMGDRSYYSKTYYGAYHTGGYLISGEDLLQALEDRGFFAWDNRLGSLGSKNITSFSNYLEGNTYAIAKQSDEEWCISDVLLNTGQSLPDTPFGLGKWACDTENNWTARGAYINTESMSRNEKTYTAYDSEFVGRVTQSNSIFNYVSEAPDIEDIKVQSVGTTGDDTKMYTEAGFTINTSDKLTGGASGHMRTLYENLSGTSADLAPEYTKVFGMTPAAAASGGTAYPQTVMGSMDYLPIPYPMEIGASGTGTGDLRSHSGPATAQEISLSLKIDEMAPRLKTAGSQYHYHRGFFVIFCEKAPRINETFHQYVLRMSNDELTATGLWIYRKVGDSNVVPSLEAVPFLDVLTGAAAPITFSVDDTHMPYTAATSLSDYSGYMDIPYGGWFDIKFKMDYRTSKILCYLPDAFDEKGAMRHMTLDCGVWPNNGSTITTTTLNSMSVWLNNFRAINIQNGSAAGEDGLNPNMDRENPGFRDDDMSSSVLIDSIKMSNYNNHYSNATVTANNSVPSPLQIPSAPICVPTYSGTYEGFSSGTDVATPSISGNASVADNYYGSESTLTHSTLSFGFEDGHQASSAQIGLFLQNFSTPNNDLVSPIFGGTADGAIYDANLKGSYTTSGTLSGFRNLNYNVNVGNHSRGKRSSGTGSAQINTDNTGSGSIGNFTQKGFIWLSGAAWETVGAGGNWFKRENPYVFARVLAANGDGTDIVVDKPEIFDLPLGSAASGGTDYVMWRPDAGFNRYLDFQGNGWWLGSGNVGAAHQFPSLNQRARRDGNVIHLNRPTNIDDQVGQSSTRSTSIEPVTMASFFPEGYNVDGASDNYKSRARLGSIFISPKKYWVNIHIANASSNNKWGEWYRPRENDAQDKGFFAYKNERYQSRFYGGGLPVSSSLPTAQGAEVGTYGTTTNESLFSDGTSINQWSTTILPGSIFDVETDYGFGVYEEPSEERTVPLYGGFINYAAPTSSSYDYIDLDSYVEQDNPEPSQKFNFGLIPFLEDYDANRPYTINMDTMLGSKPPMLIWGYNTVLPQITDFAAKSSNLDITQDNVDTLLRPKSTNINFTWGEQSDNVWYRLLWVDTDLIQSKYHKANFIAPFNENPGIDSAFYYYSSSAEYAADRNKVAMIGINSSTVEGMQGYAYSGSLLNIENNITVGGTDEFTFMCHMKPATTGTILRVSSSTHSLDMFTLRLNSSKKLVATINASASTVTSTTTYDVDSVQPLAVALTYNKNLDNNNLKMYVNGALEDTKDYTTSFSGSNSNLYFSYDDGGADIYTGTLEEMSWHTKAVYLPQNTGKFSLPTKALPDLTGTSSNKYQSRLFVMDYHNIRGTSPTDVARSNTTAWKITGV